MNCKNFAPTDGTVRLGDLKAGDYYVDHKGSIGLSNYVKLVIGEGKRVTNGIVWTGLFGPDTRVYQVKATFSLMEE